VQLPKAIFFDMDDTILDDYAVSDRSWEQVCRSVASHIETLGLDADNLLAEIREIRVWFWNDPERNRQRGLDLRAARQEIFSLALARLGIEDAALVSEVVDSYMALKSATVELIPGALDTLRRLRQEGFRLALITNGNAQEQRAKVERAELEPLFEFVLIAGEFGVSKPDQRVFRHTLKQMDVLPAETWMVGDNLLNDVGGAQAVGIYGVWVDGQGTGLPEHSPVRPDRTVRSIVELVPDAGG
jgi:putative hydrolase of the HAD superfamily